MPEFPGGMDKLFSFLREHVNYPEHAKTDGVGGKIYAQFVIEEDGSISHPKILRGINSYKSFDLEVIRVISIMPNWAPGLRQGAPVRVSYTLPFNFKAE
jgi:protein TonB